MKRTPWAVMAAVAFLAVAVFAGKDDIRRFYRMYTT